MSEAVTTDDTIGLLMRTFAAMRNENITPIAAMCGVGAWSDIVAAIQCSKVDEHGHGYTTIDGVAVCVDPFAPPRCVYVFDGHTIEQIRHRFQALLAEPST